VSAPIAFAIALQMDRIILTEPGVSVKRLCKDLGAASGLQLEATSEVASHTIVLRVSDLPAKEVMDKIATTLMATWTKTSSKGFRLERTREDRKRVYEQHLQYHAREFSTRVAQYVKMANPYKLADKKMFTDYFDRQQALQKAPRPANPWEGQEAWEELGAQMPDGRAVAKLLLALHPMKVAEIAPESEMVFSNRPNKAQHAFRFDVTPVIDELNREQQLFEEAKAGAGAPDGTMQHSSKPVVKILLQVRRSGTYWGLSYYLTGWDGSGKIALPLKQVYINPNDPPPESTLDPTLEYSLGPQEQGFAKQIQSVVFPDTPRTPLSSDQLKAILAPEDRDPLSLVAGPVLLACAQALNRNLIAVPGDTSFHTGLFPGLKPLVARVVHEDELGPKWITILPRDFYECALVDVSRSALGEYVRQGSKAGMTNLDDDVKLYAGYPYQLHGTPLPNYSLMLRFLFNPYPNAKAIRVFASLAPEQRSHLARGGKLVVSDLSPAQRDTLSDWVINDISGYCLERVGIVGRGNLPELLLQMPTESFPDGLSNCWISGDGQTEEVVRCFMSRGQMAVTAADLGVYLGRKNDPNPESIRYQLGARRTLKILFSNGLVQKGAGFPNLIFAPGGEKLAYGELPKAFRDQVEIAKAQAEKWNVPQPAQTSPPPP
jgi:hypothetical protein